MTDLDVVRFQLRLQPPQDLAQGSLWDRKAGGMSGRTSAGLCATSVTAPKAPQPPSAFVLRYVSG